VVGGEAQAERFIFAGQRAILSAWRLDGHAPSDRDQLWRCSISTDGTPVARFDMRIRLESGAREVATTAGTASQGSREKAARN
jgi:hypothetical protein